MIKELIVKEKVNRYGIMCTIMSFLTPVIIMVVSFGEKGIYPGGINTILIMDMQAQYMPYYAMISHLYDNGNSLFFSMTGALGVNAFGNVAYYLTSPFAWIATFISPELIPDYIYIITIIKIGLCGLAFCFYLRYLNRNNRLGIIYLLSCCYALTSFNVAYAMNIMWLDGIILLPFILTGIEYILDNKKEYLFILSVAISLLLNYYISFMSAVFCVIYLAIRMTEKKRWKYKLLLRFGTSAGLGVGLSAPVVLPGIMAMAQGKMVEEQYIAAPWRYSLRGMFGQFLSGGYDTVYYGGLPFLFCGTFTLLLVVLYFVRGVDRWNIKILYAGTILFYIFSMCFRPLDKAMHGFHDPTCFEVRYAFAFCCLLLIIANKGTESADLLTKKYKIPAWIKYVLACFVLTELFFNSSIITSRLMEELHYRPRSEYDRILKSKRNLLEQLDDDGLYRISDNNSYTHNEGAWLGYNGFGYFSSNYNLRTMSFLGKLGEDQADHNLTDRDRTLLEESLFGAKYRINYARGLNKDDVISRNGLYTLAENKDALSIGYMIDCDGKTEPNDLVKNAFANQNTIARDFSGVEEDVLKEIELKDLEIKNDPNLAKSIIVNAQASVSGDYWLYMDWADAEKIKQHTVMVDSEENPYNQRTPEVRSSLIINGADFGEFMQLYNSYIVYMGEFEAGQTITVEARSTKYFGDVHIAYIDHDAYNQVIEKLKSRQWSITKYAKGSFEGIIDAGEGGNMLLTIPPINGWKAKVDGKEVDYTDYRGALMVIPLDSGEHMVSIRYISPGVEVGVTIGIISLLVLMIIYLIQKKKRMRDKYE